VIGRGNHLLDSQAFEEVMPEFGHKLLVSVADNSARKSPIRGAFEEGSCPVGGGVGGLAGQDSASLRGLTGDGKCCIEAVK
jgi:hypothetical protein